MDRIDWLKSLACYSDVVQRLTAATRLSAICDFVVAQVGERGMPCSKGALYELLQRHREELMTKTGVVVGRAVARELAASSHQVSEFTELNWLVQHQHRRVEQLLNAEKKAGVVAVRVSDEMRLHADLVGRLADLKIKVGLASAVVQDMTGGRSIPPSPGAALNEPGGDGAEGLEVVKQLESPQSRRRVTDFLTRIMTKDGTADLAALADLARPAEIIDNG